MSTRQWPTKNNTAEALKILEEQYTRTSDEAEAMMKIVEFGYV